VTDPKGNITQSQFDARKRLVKTIFPDSTFTTNTYDGPGNVISTTDQAGNVVQNTYDAANQLVSVAYLNSPNAPNNTTAFAYNSDGNQTAMTDENGHTTQNAFDVLSRLTSTTLPDGSLTASRQYDAAGNLVSLTHFNGKTTSYTYDSLNRLILKTPDPSLNEPTVSYTYTATGRRNSMTVGNHITNYSYNNLDQLTAKATPEGTLSYTYDAAGNVTSVTSSNANGVWVSYTYDDLGRLSTVVDNRLQGNQTTTYTYDAVSNLATATYPNGLQATFTYDPLNRLTALSTPVSSYTYQLGPVGNRTSVTEGTGRTVNWDYDGVYRLTNETISSDPAKANGGVSYSLDPVGNRKSSTSTLSGVNPESFTFTVDDELTTDVYDNNGNTLSTGSKTFTYDSENELKTMNGGAVTVIYDGDGNRVAKTVNGVTTRYLVDDQNPTGLPQVVEELVNNVVQRQYTYGLQLISENQIVSNTWTPSFYETDGAGNVRQLTNSTGVVTDSYEYDAFGNEVSSTGETPNNYLYRSELWDPDFGAYYLRARYYNPLTGRFLSVDPEAGEGQRRYQYAAADPVNGMDPTGNADIVEYAMLIQYPQRIPFPSIHFPKGCGAECDPPPPGAPPPPPPPPPPGHWTVKVDYRPILKFKYGSNCHSIPGCHLPLRFVRHSYVEIDGPEGNHTFGVLGVNPPKNNDQEMVEDHLGWDQDPYAGSAGTQSNPVQASDQQAKAFMQTLEARAYPSTPHCPSCGIGIYHNGPLPPIDVVSFFSAYNSNTFTWNVIKNFLGMTPDPISRAPGFHYSPGYAGYP
jgi:RHS repeat-associated protein